MKVLSRLLRVVLGAVSLVALAVALAVILIGTWMFIDAIGGPATLTTATPMTFLIWYFGSVFGPPMGTPFIIAAISAAGLVFAVRE